MYLRTKNVRPIESFSNNRSNQIMAWNTGQFICPIFTIYKNIKKANMAYFLLPLTDVAVIEAHFVHFYVPGPCARFPIGGPYFTVLPDVETGGTFCHIMDRMAELVHLRLHKRVNLVHINVYSAETHPSLVGEGSADSSIM